MAKVLESKVQLHSGVFVTGRSANCGKDIQI